MPKSETEKWMESTYAALRLDGYTHVRAMAKIKSIMDDAIPKAVATIMAEICPPEPPPMCKSCNGFGFHTGGAKCDACDGAGRVAVVPATTHGEQDRS